MTTLVPHTDRAPAIHALFDPLDFTVPPEQAAHEPPEARGLPRDAVRLMVSEGARPHIVHTVFRAFPDLLDPGDVVVINTSGTLNAAVPATRADRTPLVLHLSTRLPAALWVVEVRRPEGSTTKPFYEGVAGETLHLAGGGTATLLTPHAPEQRRSPVETPSLKAPGKVRLWIATLHLPTALAPYLTRHGRPIHYDYVREAWASPYYQTVYATEPGSAEMPSAGRAFTPEVITRLVARGIHVVPLVLHTGVSSQEEGEPPYEEWYRVPAETARAVNGARAAGKRVVAVGTTVVRALETVADARGRVHPGEGWTRLVVSPETGVRAVDALLTGLHEPRATHLAMLEALAGRPHLHRAYAEALREGYLWHEFGDLHLILPQVN